MEAVLEHLPSNRNVRLSLLFSFVFNLAVGIWSSVVLAPYIYALKGSNVYVGYVQGLQGAAQAAAALPSGYFADAYRRDRILNGAGVAGLAAVLMSMLGLMGTHLSENTRYIHLAVAMVFWGVTTGMYDPALEALIADSVVSSERSRIYAWKYALLVGARASGPLTNILLFTFMGDQWSEYQMQRIFIIGVLSNIVGICILFLFNDDDALGQESNALLDKKGTSSTEQDTFEAPVSSTSTFWYRFVVKPDSSHIPVILALSDILYGLGSGMTIKFFPLFFEKKSMFSPVFVSVIFFFAPLCVVFVSISSERFSHRFGRVQTILLCESLGIVLLVIIGLTRSLWTTAAFIVPMYVLRTGLMNATTPLGKSIMMDSVSKESRGKWSSVDSMTSFGWSGSALLGGYLIDRYDYGTTFLVTAIVQFVGWCFLARLLPLVPVRPKYVVPLDSDSELDESYQMIDTA